MKKKKAALAAENAPALPENYRLSEKEEQDRFFKKLLRIVLILLLIAVLAFVAYYLFHFEFYTDYRASFKDAYTVEEACDFTPIKEEESSVPGMALAVENEFLKLYADPETGQVAVYDKRSGVITRSNPENADKDPIANKTNKAYMKSQMVVDYYNANRNAGSYDSFSMSTDRGQMTCQSLKDGVRFTYGIGEIVEIKYFVPFYLSAEWYEKVQAMATEKDFKNLARLYPSQNADGLWVLTEMAKNDNSKKKKADAALQQAGFTPEDYYAMQELGGVETAETLFFTVALDYRLKGDALEVSVPVSLIEEKGGGKIYRIQLLRYMGAAAANETGYFVVPNGSGALINFNNGKTTTPVYTQYVYGMDPLSADYTVTQNSETVRLPICGICRENSSVLLSVERGASLCYFTADVSGRTNSYNAIQPVFVVRGTETLSMFGVDGTSADIPVMENDLYDENLTVRYTFLGQEHTGYAGLANYYRDRLITEGKITAQEKKENIPFFFDVIGGVKETKHVLGFQYLAVEEMTTFTQAAEMARSLKEAGIENPVMNLQGWFNGGYYHDAPGGIRVLGQLGGKSGLNDLSSVMEELHGELFADAAFQKVSYIARHYNASQESSRYFGAGYSVRLGQVNPTNLRQTASLGYGETIYDLLSPKFLPRYVQGFTRDLKQLPVGGISLRDLGDELHSDKRRTNIIEREQALDIVEDALDTLKSTGRKLMVSGGNLYALKNADYALNVPMQTTKFYIIDREIPLYQMIVHGCVDYAGSVMNLSSESTAEQLLKMVEYGANCHYLFTEADATQMKYTGLNRFYATRFDTWKEQAVESYRYVNAALAPVSGAMITNHETLEEDLVRVTYSNGVCIYVNYGDHAVLMDGQSVPARGYALGGAAL